MIPKQLPCHIPSERAVLGACLLDDQAASRACASLREKDFYLEPHRIVFRAITEINEKGSPVDPVVLSDHLKGNRAFEKVGGTAFISDLFSSIPSVANISHYLGIVKDKARLRRLHRAAMSVAQDALKENATASEVEQTFQAAAFSAFSSDTKGQKRLRRLDEIIPGAIREMEESKGWGICSGLTDLDAITRGFFPGDLIFIGARPSMGKTSLAADCMFSAMAAGQPVAMFSIEMRENDMVKRMLSKQARVNLQRIRSGDMTQSDWERVTAAMGDLEDVPVHITDEEHLTVPKMRSMLMEMTLRYGYKADLAIVDYLQFMRHGAAESQNQAVGRTSRDLKALAKSMNIPIIVLSQLNRELEKRPNKRPQLSDLRDSGSIEQDADVIIFLYRHEVYAKDDPSFKGKAEIIVAKQRNGPTGVADVAWVASTATFKNAVPEGVTENYMEVM